MAWTIEVGPRARRTFKKLDCATAARLIAALESVAMLDDPRSRGRALTGPMVGLWRYSAGDWRIICQLREATLVILVVEIGNRRDVYR